MFVSLVRWNEVDENGKPKASVKDLLECARARIEPLDDGAVMLQLEGCPDCGQLRFHLDKSKTQIYLMNNEGKNLDSYRWS